MEALILLVPISLLLVGVAVWFFLRMSDSGQFDDPEGPAYSILMDDDRPGGDDTPARRREANLTTPDAALQHKSASGTDATAPTPRDERRTNEQTNENLERREGA